MSAPLIERECIPHTFCLFLVNKSFVWRQTLLEEARYPQPSSRPSARLARGPGSITTAVTIRHALGLWIPGSRASPAPRDDGCG
jgi:hypothetical protein